MYSPSCHVPLTRTAPHQPAAPHALARGMAAAWVSSHPGWTRLTSRCPAPRELKACGGPQRAAARRERELPRTRNAPTRAGSKAKAAAKKGRAKVKTGKLSTKTTTLAGRFRDAGEGAGFAPLPAALVARGPAVALAYTYLAGALYTRSLFSST